jgi:hypothetical protein
MSTKTKDAAKEPKIEVKYIKHTFSSEEKNTLGQNLARAFSDRRGKEAEFDQVKAHFKSEIAEKDARIENLSTSLVNGFDMRNESCVVILAPEQKKKFFYLEAGFNPAEPREPALVEEMTPADFQQELLEAESKFEKREEIALFQATDGAFGAVVVGTFNGRWYSALRIHVGRHEIMERLDTEQKGFKNRHDAVARAAKLASEWFKEKFKADAKGFEQPMLDAIAPHVQPDRVE